MKRELPGRITDSISNMDDKFQVNVMFTFSPLQLHNIKYKIVLFKHNIYFSLPY